MKKFALIAVALCVAVLMAAPASALEITTDGYYRAQYLGAWNTEMTEDGDSNSFGAMRLRVNNVIKVNDNLGVRTRFRAVNRRWGGGDDSSISRRSPALAGKRCFHLSGTVMTSGMCSPLS